MSLPALDGSSSSSSTAAAAAAAERERELQRQIALAAERAKLMAKLKDSNNYRKNTDPALAARVGLPGEPVDTAAMNKDKARVATLNTDLAKNPNAVKIYNAQQTLGTQQSQLKSAQSDLATKTAALNKAFPDGAPTNACSPKYDSLKNDVDTATSKVKTLTSSVATTKSSIQTTTQAATYVAPASPTGTPTPSTPTPTKPTKKPDGYKAGDAKPSYKPGTVHTVKSGDTLWNVSTQALKAQGVAHPTDDQIAAGVKTISDTSRSDPTKRDQFPKVNIADAHRVGKDPNLVYPGQQVLVPDMSQVIHPGKTFKWDPTQNKLVDPTTAATDGRVAKTKTDIAQVNKETTTESGLEQADDSANQAYLKDRPLLAKYLNEGRPASMVETVAAEGRRADALDQRRAKPPAADTKDANASLAAYNGTKHQSDTYIDSHPKLKAWIDAGKPSDMVPDVADEYRMGQVRANPTAAQKSTVANEVKTYTGLQQADDSAAEAYLKDRPKLATYLDAKPADQAAQLVDVANEADAATTLENPSAGDKTDAQSSLAAYNGTKHQSDDYIKKHPALKAWIDAGEPARGTALVAAEYRAVEAGATVG